MVLPLELPAPELPLTLPLLLPVPPLLEVELHALSHAVHVAALLAETQLASLALDWHTCDEAFDALKLPPGHMQARRSPHPLSSPDSAEGQLLLTHAMHAEPSSEERQAS